MRNANTTTTADHARRHCRQAGFLVSGRGLGLSGWGLGRLVSAWAGTAIHPLSLTWILLSGLLLSGIGFSLLVIGADPLSHSDDELLSSTRDSLAESSAIGEPEHAGWSPDDGLRMPDHASQAEPLLSS